MLPLLFQCFLHKSTFPLHLRCFLCEDTSPYSSDDVLKVNILQMCVEHNHHFYLYSKLDRKKVYIFLQAKLHSSLCVVRNKMGRININLKTSSCSRLMAFLLLRSYISNQEAFFFSESDSHNVAWVFISNGMSLTLTST